MLGTELTVRHEHLPGYEVACTVVGALYVVLGGSMVVRGAKSAMQPFGVPDLVLSSPHFADLFHWVFVHMTVLGVSIVLLGRYVVQGRSQRIVARVLCVATIHYAYLDFRTSDSLLGNGLYHGPASLVPPVIDVVVVLVFAVLGFRSLRAIEAPAPSPGEGAVS